jgi:hypothetical protein
MPAKLGDDNLPFANKSKAETFEESETTLSHSDTRVKSGSVELGGTATSTCDLSTINYPVTTGSKAGIVINPNNNIGGVRATITDLRAPGPGEVRLEATDGTLLDSVTDVSSGETADLWAGLSSGTDYYLLYVPSDETEMVEMDTPETSTDIDVTDGYDSGAIQSTGYQFTTVSALTEATSGSVTVSWPMPPDIYAWDTAKFQRSTDGGSVSVYIEEDQSDGWTEIAGPISRGDAITADPSNNVRFRVDLSRPDTASNPTIDALYRRHTL